MRNQPKLRIIKMAEQAGLKLSIDQQVAFERAVKLIVGECAEVAFCNFHVSGGDLGDLMKQHFGIQS